MKQKKTVIGWIGKTQKIKDVLRPNGDSDYTMVLDGKRRGKWAWENTDWPPKKVKITVEVISDE